LVKKGKRKFTHIIRQIGRKCFAAICMGSAFHKGDCSRPWFAEMLLGSDTTPLPYNVCTFDDFGWWDGRRVKHVMMIVYSRRQE